MIIKIIDLIIKIIDMSVSFRHLHLERIYKSTRPVIHTSHANRLESYISPSHNLLDNQIVILHQ